MLGPAIIGLVLILGDDGDARAARDRAQLVVFAYQAGLVTPRAAG
jgi:hypothetical protein